MKNKFILEDIKRIHEIMGSNPKNILIEAILGSASDDFIRGFLTLLGKDAPDVADDILTRVVQKNSAASQKMATEGITDFAGLLANGSDDLIRTFFKESGALANLSDDFGRILLKLAQEGDGVVAPLMSDIERIVAAGVPDAIEQLKQTLKNAGIADDVINLIINSAKNAGKIVNVTTEVFAKLLDVQMRFIKSLKNTKMWKNLPKDAQLRLETQWKLESEASLKRVFGEGGPRSEQAMWKAMNDELAQLAADAARAGIRDLPKVPTINAGTAITIAKYLGYSVGAGILLKLIQEGTMPQYTGVLGGAVGAFLNGIGRELGKSDNTQTNTPTSTTDDSDKASDEEKGILD